MLTLDEQTWLASAGAAAKASEFEWHVPALLTLAQATLESGWGQFCPANNCFGIKWAEGDYGQQYLETEEEIDGKLQPVRALFATYRTLGDAFDAHGELLATHPQYEPLLHQYLEDKNLSRYVAAVAHVYATDSAYAGKIFNLMADSRIVNAVQPQVQNV